MPSFPFVFLLALTCTLRQRSPCLRKGQRGPKSGSKRLTWARSPCREARRTDEAGVLRREINYPAIILFLVRTRSNEGKRTVSGYGGATGDDETKDTFVESI